MDDLLTSYTNEQLISELEQGHYWYSDGRFFASAEKLTHRKLTSVENAVYFRFYC